MQTLKLLVDDKIYDKLLFLLSKFDRDELEIIQDKSEFTTTKKYFNAELEEIRNGKANFMLLEEAEARIEKAIKKHEDNS
jgi:hypothetical protein